jgi:hypothetical protein
MSQRPELASLGGLRATALVTLLVGASASVAMTLYAIRNNPSQLLMVLFTLWVLGPFIVLELVHLASSHWSILTRLAIYGLMPLLTIVSMIVYGQRILRPRRSTGAFVFVALPPLSVLTILIVVAVAGLISRRRMISQ